VIDWLDQVVERAGLEISSEPRVLDVALDQATALQHLAHLCADLLDQPLQLVRAGPCHGAEQRRVGALQQIRPVQKAPERRGCGRQRVLRLRGSELLISLRTGSSLAI
jgi:hypothetical protein